MKSTFGTYLDMLSKATEFIPEDNVIRACKEIIRTRDSGSTVFLAGNGGSAGNAMHLANDYIYGATNKQGKALRVNALPSNQSILTCLGNDIGYDDIFSHQLNVLGKPGDVIILLSGSGNSPNIINAANAAHNLGITTIAILGFDGGACKALVDIPIHTPVNDMQVSEDIQLIIGHYFMKELRAS